MAPAPFPNYGPKNDSNLLNFPQMGPNPNQGGCVNFPDCTGR
jgi:hypothetical protein